eukprot:TRINITY_DN6213_c0_g1_i1.p1 TRINITY_DN6213_c0_g1~~TRINITY_DN6213_c0_g1_i1.p1  ORF type:complete len:1371 (-),score=496.08 TRINITY_DN6213_c0_g1_i1:61-4173(-)
MIAKEGGEKNENNVTAVPSSSSLITGGTMRTSDLRSIAHDLKTKALEVASNSFSTDLRRTISPLGFGLKGDSFYITNERYLRTIFDDVKSFNLFANAQGGSNGSSGSFPKISPSISPSLTPVQSPQVEPKRGLFKSLSRTTSKNALKDLFKGSVSQPFSDPDTPNSSSSPVTFQATISPSIIISPFENHSPATTINHEHHNNINNNFTNDEGLTPPETRQRSATVIMKEEEDEVIYRTGTNDSSGTPPKENSPKQSDPEAGKVLRRTSSDSAQTMHPIEKLVVENRARRNTDDEGTRKGDVSEKTREKVERMQHYIEEYYWELFSYLYTRQKRKLKLDETIAESSDRNQFEVANIARTAMIRETMLLRSRRLCGRLSDYQLIKRIGKGAYGEVFLAVKANTNEPLALKKLSKQNLRLKNQIAHVKTEQDVLVADTSSQWLVHLLYTFEDSEYIYFAMEFIPGGDLRAFLEKKESLEEHEAQFYMAEMLLAVDALHRLGYIHRDLKPDNFLINRDGHLKLADFGLSKKGVVESYREPFKGQMPTAKLFTASTVTRRKKYQDNNRRQKAYSMVGSPDYMAIELLRGKGYEFDCDWWSLGCILFEMLVGFPPFCADTPHDVFSNVMNFKVTLENPEGNDGDPFLSEVTWDIITKLITEPETRLGSSSIDEIKNHKFFNGIHWETLGKMDEPCPPFVPKLLSDDDTSYFDRAEPVQMDREHAGTFAEKLSSIPMNSSTSALNHFTFSSRGFVGNDAPSGRQGQLISEERGRRLSVGERNLSMGAKKLRKSSSFGSALRKVSSIDSLGNQLVKVYSRAGRIGRRNSVAGPTSLNSLSIQDWRMILSGAHILVIPRRTVILKEGGWNRNLYRIKSGTVVVEKEVQVNETQTKIVTLTHLERNRVFGEMSFMEESWKPDEEDNDTGNISASVVADTEVELYKIDRLFILQLFKVNLDLFERFHKILAIMLAERCMNMPYKREMDKLRGLEVDDQMTQKLVHFPSPNIQIGTKAEMTKKNSKFQKRFRLPHTEFVVSEYTCIYLEGKKHRYHGTLFVGKHVLCFFGKVFGRKVKVVIKLPTMLKLEKVESNKFSVTEEKERVEISYLFQPTENVDEVLSVIESIYDASRSRAELKRASISVGNEEDARITRGAGPPSLFRDINMEDLKDSLNENELGHSNDSKENNLIGGFERIQLTDSERGLLSLSVGNIMEEPSVRSAEEALAQELSLTQEDWDLILNGAECETYMKDMVILSQGESFGKIYQIGNGLCRIEKQNESGKTEIVGTMNGAEMFGEISFLSGQGASVSIIADENDVDIYVIDRVHILGLFEKHPGMGGKFYKFMALILSRRIRQREVEEQLRFGLNGTELPFTMTHLG